MPLVIEHQSTSGSIIRTTPKTNPNPPPASIPLLVTLMTLRTSINYSQTHLMAANKRQTLATSSNQRAHHHHHSHYNNHLGPSRFLLAPVGGPKGRSDTWETPRPYISANACPQDQAHLGSLLALPTSGSFPPYVTTVHICYHR